MRRMHPTVLLAIGTAGLMAVLGSAPLAHAGSSADWTQLSAFPDGGGYPKGKNTDEPTVGRLGSNLQVIWRGQVSPELTSYYTAILTPTGTTATSSREVISNWATLIGNPRLIRVGGQQFLAFSGLQSTNANAPFTTGAELAATSLDGLTWSVNAGSLSATMNAYVGTGNDAVDSAGTPVWVGNSGTSNGLTWHVGLSPTEPAPTGSDASHLLAGCCAYQAAAARDQATGVVYAAFFSNSGAPGEIGIWTGQILPSPAGFTRAPGSATDPGGGEQALEPGQRVAMVARTGGGVYAAYKLGYPIVTGIRILNVSTGATLDVPGSAGASRIALAAGAGGRLWIAWTAKGVLKVAHTNPDVTVAGAAGALGAPKGSEAIWKVVADSSGLASPSESLDVVVTAQSASGQVNVWHAQALRTLSVTAPSQVAKGGTITVKVTDAGQPVPGAKVKVTGDSATTDSSGTATLRAPARSRAYTVTAQRSGFNKGSTRIKVG